MLNLTMRHNKIRLLVTGLVPAALLVIGVLGPVNPLKAQKTTRVNIEHADLLKISKENGINVSILMGNAILSQDSTFFYCDTAYKYDNNDVRAIGHVHISYSDSVHLYGDFLTYSGNTKIAVLDSNVRLVDKRATLYTDHLEYDRNRNTAYYYTGGRIVDDKNVLTSIKGRYFTETYEFLFSDSVVAVNPDYTMYSDTLRYNTGSEIVFIEGPADLYGKEDHIYSEKGWYDTRTNQAELTRNNSIKHKEQILKGDWIYYDQEKEYGKAVGNVWMKDTVQKLILEGGIGEFYRNEKYSYITDSARAILLDTYDSLYLHADSFILALDSADGARMLFAHHRLKFFREDLQGLCDSLVFRVQDSVIALLKNPVLWSDENQLTADSMWMHISENHIDSMTLFNMAFIISRDSSETYNQIKGKQMKAYFRNNQLYSIKVLGNAETIYYVRDENLELIGINRSLASNMAILLENRKVKQINYLTKPEAVLYPAAELSKEDQFLKDFIWITGQRPKNKNDIFIWEEKPGSEN
jgi:lipopolysaccharide export system protein LptA